MWARDFECALGLWLAASPFVLAHPPGSGPWAIDLACAAAIVLLSLASYARRTRRAHLLELAVAAFLVAAGWLGRHGELAAAAQNELASGLVLAMLAIVPSEASRPPETWRARG